MCTMCGDGRWITVLLPSISHDDHDDNIVFIIMMTNIVMTTIVTIMATILRTIIITMIVLFFSHVSRAHIAVV